jgi:hypothetical protein
MFAVCAWTQIAVSAISLIPFCRGSFNCINKTSICQKFQQKAIFETLATQI